MFIGFTLLIVGFIFMMWFRDKYNQPRYNRPFAFNNPIFVLIGTILWVSLIFAGIAFVFLSSKSVGILTLIATVVFYVMMNLIGGSKSTKRAMLNSYQKIKAAYPEDDEQEILCKVLKFRYRFWDDKDIRSFVEDNKNIRELRNMVCYK